MKFKVLGLILLLAFSGCKKNKEMTISGRVTDKADNSGIGGATIEVFYKPYKNGVFNTSYSKLAATTTDGSGNYSFHMEKPVTSDFKFVVKATNYFDAEKIVNPDDLSQKKENTLNFTTDPSCTLQIHIKNTSPWDADDLINFQTLGSNASCSSCCTSTPIVKYGTSVDTVYTCTRIAKRYVKYSYIEVKNGNTTLVNDSVYCAPGVTVNLDVFY